MKLLIILMISTLLSTSVMAGSKRVSSAYCSKISRKLRKEGKKEGYSKKEVRQAVQVLDALCQAAIKERLKVKEFEYFDSLRDGRFNSMIAKHEPIRSSQALV